MKETLVPPKEADDPLATGPLRSRLLVPLVSLTWPTAGALPFLFGIFVD